MSKRIVYRDGVPARRRDWSRQELALLRRAAGVLWRPGLSLESDSGVADEGDPWFVLCDEDSGEVLVHFARIGGTYVVCAPSLNGALTGRDLPNLVERFLGSCPDREMNSVRIRSAPAA
jgi:hypothetical protein